MVTVQQTPDYDAFGEPTTVSRPRVDTTRRERKIAIAVFWSVALLLIAGRVYQHDIIAGPQAHTMEMASR